MIAVLRFLFVIPFAFVAACGAAAFALLWPFVDLSPRVLDDPVVMIELAFGFVAQAAQVGSAVLIPWAIVMIVSEIFALSSLVLHAVIGAAGGFALSRAWYGDAVPGDIQTAMLAGGVAFMLVYWILAGRSAGRWRERGHIVPPPSPGEQVP